MPITEVRSIVVIYSYLGQINKYLDVNTVTLHVIINQQTLNPLFPFRIISAPFCIIGTVGEAQHKLVTFWL